MKYAYAYDKGGKLARFFGVSGIPHSVLVDGNGTVVWAGHPAGLTDSLITQATQGTLPLPLWEWPSEAKAVRSALQKKAFKTAIDAAADLSADARGEEIRAALKGMVQSRMEFLEGALAKGDFLTVVETSASLKKELAGLPEEARVGEIASQVAADDKAQEVLKGQQKLAKIRAKGARKEKDVRAAISDLQKLKKDYPGTFVESDADSLIRSLEASLRRE